MSTLEANGVVIVRLDLPAGAGVGRGITEPAGLSGQAHAVGAAAAVASSAGRQGHDHGAGRRRAPMAGRG